MISAKRVEDFALMQGVPVEDLQRGVSAASDLLVRFVRTLPESLQIPDTLARIAARDDMVYDVVEAAGLSLCKENMLLKNEVSDLHDALMASESSNLAVLSKLHMAHATYAFCLSDGASGLAENHDLLGDDLPDWRVTIVLRGSPKDGDLKYERITLLCSHIDMVRFFPKAELTTVNPDPWADGPADLTSFGSSQALEADESPL